VSFCHRIAPSDRLTLLEVLGGGVDELQSDELEATSLKAADNLADETALDAVRLLRGENVNMISISLGIRR